MTIQMSKRPHDGMGRNPKKYKPCLECKKRPYFNIEGDPKGIYCVDHKKDEMVNVKAKTCLECKKRPYFNVEGDPKGVYCAAHKKQGMVDVISKKCLDCKKKPNFNVEGETKGIYCVDHKKQGMVDVKNKKCLECKKRPTFNVEGETKGVYCVDHKKEGMVNVISKTCLECKKQPFYNVDGETKGIYCFDHKKEGMVNVVHKTCLDLECKKRPNFNVEGKTKGVYCFAHKKQGMVNVVDKTCKSDWCSTQVGEKYDGYCLFCFMNLFPEKPVCRNYKTKEYEVVEFVKTEFPELLWTADKVVSGGCSRRRPDLLADFGSHALIVENDENQHVDYDCSCQNKRIMELSQDLGHRPIVFIRFNPDEYESNGKTVTSCWGLNKKGIIGVKKSKQVEWAHRLDCLKQQIHYWISHSTHKTIEIVQLFYDT